MPMQLPGLSTGRLRISRARLRKALLEQLPEASITYQRTCTGASLLRPDGSHQLEDRVRLHFSDGKQTDCDILVVADGSSSKLRAALRPGEQKGYLGVCMISVCYPSGVIQSIAVARNTGMHESCNCLFVHLCIHAGATCRMFAAPASQSSDAHQNGHSTFASIAQNCSGFSAVHVNREPCAYLRPVSRCKKGVCVFPAASVLGPLADTHSQINDIHSLGLQQR